MLEIIQSIGLLGFGLFRIYQFGIPYILVGSTTQIFLDSFFDFLTSGVGILLLSVPILIIGVALLRLKSWAWFWATAFQGLSLMFALFEYLLHKPNYILMVIGIVIVFYLNQREVQAVFRGRYGMAGK